MLLLKWLDKYVVDQKENCRKASRSRWKDQSRLKGGRAKRSEKKGVGGLLVTYLILKV